MALRVRTLDNAAEGAWGAFVRDTPEATFFHLSPWLKLASSRPWART